ncbi:hypothetical protein MASR2M18_12180 [Ignavibacteria bacterium]|nr:VCBS repeat-containing protein [Bacteroidota bacterium]MCZ2133285.1 FG-GAP-like repeat-containing protein [Bacteroidota bacterium]
MKNIFNVIVPLFLIFISSASAQKPEILWQFDTFDASYGQSAAADIDGDGRLEIVFGCYRNDSCVYALNAENGSLLWKVNTSRPGKEGCNDVAPLIYDINGDGHLEVIVPSSCNDTTFCFDGRDGAVIWKTPTAGSDSPPIIDDIDGDGNMEILHGQFGGYVICIDARSGRIKWNLEVDTKSWVQTAPTILDANGDGNSDFAVGTWNLASSAQSAYYVFEGKTQKLLWSYPVGNHIYHGSAAADIDSDGKMELLVGAYNDTLYCFDAASGLVKWKYYGRGGYIGAPVTIADFDGDGVCDIAFCSGYTIGVLNNKGNLLWKYNLPYIETAFRGVIAADINGDEYKDAIFCTSGGKLIALNGKKGEEIWKINIGEYSGIDKFDINHAPLIADFNGDGLLDIFFVGGFSEYPDFSKNRGRAYLLSIGKGNGPDWLMFQHDFRRRSALCGAQSVSVKEEFTSPQFSVIQDFDSREITFHSSSNLSGTAVIVNTLGQIMLKKGIEPKCKNKIDLDKIPAGAYYFMVKSSHGIELYGSMLLK